MPTARLRHLQGTEKVMVNLNREIAKMEHRSLGGAIEAVEFIHADTEKTPPLTPVDTGNLRSSWTVALFRKKGQSIIKFGYSANYALYVHEMLEGASAINWSRPNSGAKWFEYAIKRNVTRILTIIGNKARII